MNERQNEKMKMTNEMIRKDEVEKMINKVRQEFAEVKRELRES